MAKQYNPWTGFLEDTSAKANVNDAAPIIGKKYAIRGKEFKVLEVKGDNVKVLGSDGIVSHLNIKMFDEKPTIDKAIHNCDSNVKLVKTVAKKNGYAIHIVSGEYGERIVLTFPGENYNNPHMWLGSNTPSNMSKAQEMLFEFAARAKDSKCKIAIDKSIRNCDSEKIILPEISDTWRLIDKYNIKYTNNAGGIQIDVDEAVSKGVNKEYIKKLSKMSKLYGRGDF